MSSRKWWLQQEGLFLPDVNESRVDEQSWWLCDIPSDRALQWNHSPVPGCSWLPVQVAPRAYRISAMFLAGGSINRGEGECVLPRLPGVPLGGATQPSASCGPLPRAIPAYLEQSLEWAWFILGRVAKVKEGLWLTSAVLLMLPTRDTGKDVWSEGPLTLTDNPHTLRSVKHRAALWGYVPCPLQGRRVVLIDNLTEGI